LVIADWSLDISRFFAEGIAKDLGEGGAVRTIRSAALGCFLLSGFAALVYEIVWVRILGQIFGNTTFAIATVLAAFMAGLALGSYSFGRLAGRLQNDLLAYGTLEGLIGLYGLLILPLFGVVRRVYFAVYPHVEAAPILSILVLFVLAFGLLMVPTVLMGATLPLLSRFFVTRLEQVGGRVGDLYAMNTLGAVAGCALAGYVMIPEMGLRASIFTAAAVNFAVAAAIAGMVVWLRRHPTAAQTFAPAAPTLDAQAPTPTAGTSAPRAGVRGPLEAFLLLSLAASGAASMIYENAWTRALALVIGMSTYAFTTMLTTFLIGLALGSFLYARWWGRSPGRLWAFGAMQVGIGIAALATIPLFERLPFLFLRLKASFADSFVLLLVVQATLSFLVMILPTILAGMTFPIVARLFTRGVYEVGSSVGTAYASNTLGAIVGALAGGFLLIPWLGVQHAINVGVAINVLVGIGLIAADTALAPPARWAWGAAAAAVTGAAIALFPAWDRHVVTSGVTIYASSYAGLPRESMKREYMHKDALLFYREGATATISVHAHRYDDYRYLKTNGKVDSSYGDEPNMLLTGYLPLLYHPAAQRVVIIGMGGGYTAKAVAAFPVQRIEVAEIEPAVVEGARAFAARNGNVLDDRRLRVIAADGRNYIQATPQQFDVIISMPSNPWIAGVANLYTREFYELARGKLRPDGTFAQWVQNYHMSPDDLRMILHTFAESFPHVSLWAVDESDLILLGTLREQTISHRTLQTIFAENQAVRQDLARLGFLDPFGLRAMYLMGNDGIRRFSRGAELNSDDLPRLEFSAPKHLESSTTGLNVRLLKDHREDLRFAGEVDFPRRPRGWARYVMARALKAVGASEGALHEVTQAIAERPDEAEYRLLRAELLADAGRSREALADFKTALALRPSDPSSVVDLGMKLEWDEAGELYRALALLRPQSPAVLERLGQVLEHEGDRAGAIARYRQALEVNPEAGGIRSRLGRILVRGGQYAAGLQELERARTTGGESGDFYAALGDALVGVDRPAEAVEAYTRALRESVENVSLRVRLAKALAAAGRRGEAARRFREALALDGENAEAAEGLRALGQRY
jgi:spermidine synthase